MAAAKSSEEEKKEEADSASGKQDPEVKEEPAKMSALIKQECLKIVTDFIQNEAFMKQVNET